MRFLLAFLYIVTLCFAQNFNATNWFAFMINQVSLVGNDAAWCPAGGPNKMGGNLHANVNAITAPALAFTNHADHIQYIPTVEVPTMFSFSTAAKSLTEAVIGGIDVGTPNPCYTHDGIYCKPSKVDWDFSRAFQDSHYHAESDKYFLVGAFGFDPSTGQPFSGVAISADGGMSFTSKKMPTPPFGTIAKYMAVVSDQVWYVSASIFPNNQAKEQGYYSLHPNVHVKTSKAAEHAANPDVKFGPLGDDTDGFLTYIFKTVDGGNTYTQVYQNWDFSGNKISCPSEDVCYFVAENNINGSIVVGTKDGGATWQQLLFVPNKSLVSCTFLSETEGWIGGAYLNPAGQFDGFLSYTADGGQTWAHKNFENWYFFDLQFQTPKVGYFAATDNSGVSTIVRYTHA